MYDRRLNGNVLSFGHAGILYKDSFVMYDRQTNSLWVHVTGMAEVGELKGQQLKFMPSTITTWKKWKEQYPQTLVLPGYRRGGFMGTYRGVYNNRNLGLQILVKFKAKLYPFKVLANKPIVNDHFNGKDVVVFYSAQDRTGTAWIRRVNGKTLTFKGANRKDDHGNTLLQDSQTGSLWSWLTGEAVEGELSGQQLKQLAYNPILNDRFVAFYPEGLIFK